MATKECPICMTECSLVANSNEAPVFPILKTGNCCEHVFCKKCLTDWLLKAPTRCRTQRYFDGNFKRLDVGCPICKGPIAGFWPILPGQVQSFEVLWGPDDIRYVLEENEIIEVSSDVPYLKTKQTTKGYFIDGPNSQVEEITIDDDNEETENGYNFGASTAGENGGNTASDEIQDLSPGVPIASGSRPGLIEGAMSGNESSAVNPHVENAPLL